MTYIAIIKGYCAILILFIPSTYVNGGWAASSILFIFAAWISTICVIRLIESGLKIGIYSYSGIVERALGHKAKLVTDIMIAATQYSFTISAMSFETESLKSSVDGIFGLDTSKTYYAISLLCIIIPIAWVRDIGRLSWTFMIGNFVILGTVIVVSYYCISSLVENGPGPDLQALNRNSWLVTLGFVVYAYEGIGVVMPIMQTCANPDQFTNILAAAILTLSVIYILFGALGYRTYGSNMTSPLITEMLPPADTVVITTKLVFIVNLICSYALCIYPTNKIIESWIFGKKKDSSAVIYWLKNISRAVVATTAMYFGVALAS